jgi:hypothetical protein
MTVTLTLRQLIGLNLPDRTSVCFKGRLKPRGDLSDLRISRHFYVDQTYKIYTSWGSPRIYDDTNCIWTDETISDLRKQEGSFAKHGKGAAYGRMDEYLFVIDGEVLENLNRGDDAIDAMSYAEEEGYDYNTSGKDISKHDVYIKPDNEKGIPMNSEKFLKKINGKVMEDMAQEAFKKQIVHVDLGTLLSKNVFIQEMKFGEKKILTGIKVEDETLVLIFKEGTVIIES